MSTAMMQQPQTLPHRKPVPGRMDRPSYNNLQQQQQYPREASNSRATSITRPPSGSPGSTTMQSQYPPPPQQQQQQQQPYNQPARRTPSSISSASSGLQRIPTNASANLPRRSTSSRSNSSASPTSYVALMRKQKATVWCDRAQAEDPRILAAQRAAKMRAAMEVAGGSHRFSTSSTAAGSSSSGGIRSKIRHHGVTKASTYTGQANLAGAGVPMRLSASEVDEGDSDEEDSKYVSQYYGGGSGHGRNGSRNSSMGSAQQQRSNTGLGTPGSGRSPEGTMSNLAEEETPVPNAQNLNAADYFAAGGGDGDVDESSYGSLSGLPQRTETQKEKLTAEELRRRGSVDERTMTMTGTRLFIANPDRDLSD